jgi:hypothetical protein
MRPFYITVGTGPRRDYRDEDRASAESITLPVSAFAAGAAAGGGASSRRDTQPMRQSGGEAERPRRRLASSPTTPILDRRPPPHASSWPSHPRASAGFRGAGSTSVGASTGAWARAGRNTRTSTAPVPRHPGTDQNRVAHPLDERGTRRCHQSLAPSSDLSRDRGGRPTGSPAG